MICLFVKIVYYTKSGVAVQLASISSATDKLKMFEFIHTCIFEANTDQATPTTWLNCYFFS